MHLEVPAVCTQEAISCTNSFLDFSCACKPPMYLHMTDTQWPCTNNYHCLILSNKQAKIEVISETSPGQNPIQPPQTTQFTNTHAHLSNNKSARNIFKATKQTRLYFKGEKYNFTKNRQPADHQ